MNFFQELIKMLGDNEHINIAVTKRSNTELVVSIAPVQAEKDKKPIRPFVLHATASELDTDFFAEFQKSKVPVKAEGIFSNAEEVVDDTEKENEGETEKAAKKVAAKNTKKADKVKTLVKAAEIRNEVAKEDPRIKKWSEQINTALEGQDFFNALTVVDKALKQFPGNESLTKIRQKVVAAKASAELEEDDDVKVPAAAPKKAKEKVAVTEELVEEEPEIVMEGDDETMEIDATADADTDDDF